MTPIAKDAITSAYPNPTAEDVLEFARSRGAQFIDFKFVDLPGTWQHFSAPVAALSPRDLEEGLGFDGSSIRGFQAIHESDMIVIPDPKTAFMDPVYKVPTLSIICDVYDPISRRPYTRDPRHIARKAERFLAETGIATTAYFGPEVEFYIFTDLRFDQTSYSGFYYIGSDEGIWDSGANGQSGRNLAYRPRYKEGYFPVPPTDKLQDLRSEIVLRLMQVGIQVEIHHHEVGTAGQGEIDMRFQTLTKMADNVMIYKYIIKNTCNERGYVATFMPKPIFGDNGSGMHTHVSLWKDGTNLFFDETGYALISDLARWFIGGLLAHAPSLLALCAPTTNSYRRLVPGYEAPINLVYSQRNRSACVRIPMYSDNPAAKRIEFRPPDPSANPYLAFAAILMAGIDGIINRTEPPAPIDKDLYELEPEEAAAIKSTPGSLGEVLDALEHDHEYLLRGDVFTPDVIETWINYKRERELKQVNLRPHPYEFYLYHDV